VSASFAFRASYRHYALVSDQSESFSVVFTATSRDWTRAVLARQDIAGVTRRRRWLGGLIAVLGAIGGVFSRLANTQDLSLLDVLLPAGFIAFGVLWGTDLFVKQGIAGWLKANPNLLLPSDNTLTDAEYIATSEGIEQRVMWANFKSVILLSDMVVLTMGEGVGGGLGVLPRRGLDEATRWTELVDFVLTRVGGELLTSRR
jgi:hypothetical protein